MVTNRDHLSAELEEKQNIFNAMRERRDALQKVYKQLESKE
jgi:hypothetical protein